MGLTQTWVSGLGLWVGALLAVAGCSSEDSDADRDTAASTGTMTSTSSGISPDSVGSSTTSGTTTNASTAFSANSAGTSGPANTATGSLTTSTGAGGSGETSGSANSSSMNTGDTASTTSGLGDVQHCVFDTGCMEFRGHRPVCQLSDEQNCSSVLDGEYAAGPCAADRYSREEEEATFCGVTLTYWE